MNTNRDSFWEAIPLFSEKLHAYRSYHQHEINISLHVIGIPDIILSLFMFAMAGVFSQLIVLNVIGVMLGFALVALLVFHLGWGGWRGVGAAILGALFAGLSFSGLVVEYFWAWLLVEGFIFSIFMIVGGQAGAGVSRKHNIIALILGAVTLAGIFFGVVLGPGFGSVSVSPWIAAAALFVMGFYYHIPGHKLFEGNRPALLDDITQSFLAAPQEVVDIVTRPIRS